MIRISLKDDRIGSISERYWWLDSDDVKPKNQPSMKHGKWFYYFKSDLHEWFVDHNIKYRLKFYEEPKTDILFYYESEAILFKLTWL